MNIEERTIEAYGVASDLLGKLCDLKRYMAEEFVEQHNNNGNDLLRKDTNTIHRVALEFSHIMIDMETLVPIKNKLKKDIDSNAS